ncbi:MULTISPECIES: GtrA family protein [Streptomyces]|uniref:GtrA family protein n=2 Tax=Streptomyces TaxID=1883 RepID=A0ACC6Q4F9_9ACTN|nr:GtrA family protein [Streptomyces sp. NBC_01167]
MPRPVPELPMHEAKPRQNATPPPLMREMLRFGTVGGLGVAVNFAVFNLCRAATSESVVRCSIAGTAAAIVFNYLGYRYFAYRERDKRSPARQFSLFVAFSLVGLLIENGTLYAATYWLGWNGVLQNNLVKALGLAAATAFRFWAYRTWVFLLPSGAYGRDSPAPQGRGS